MGHNGDGVFLGINIWFASSFFLIGYGVLRAAYPVLRQDRFAQPVPVGSFLPRSCHIIQEPYILIIQVVKKIILLFSVFSC